ncbi:MAG: polysaccharide deacetylase family protein [Thermoanaerobaculales bacterium]|nr:polysaccharide deacetylase family protein [Thermoanaerobaculales bacterium]
MIGSALLHLMGGAAYILWPSRWAVILASMIANHAVVAAAGIHPRNQLMGPNRSRLDTDADATNQIALTFDDGPDPEVTPRVLEILAQQNCRATFFVIGERAEAQPDLVRAVVQAGHDLGNHSWDHSSAFFFHSPSQLAAQIDRTQDLLEELSGKRPRLFRPPAGIRSPLLESQLARRNLALVSWNRRAFDTVERRPAKILRRMTKNLGPGDILLLHDGSVARTAAGVPVVLEILPELLEIIQAQNLEPVLIT